MVRAKDSSLGLPFKTEIHRVLNKSKLVSEEIDQLYIVILLLYIDLNFNFMCYWVGRRVVRVRCITNFSLKRVLAIFLVLRESSRINCCYFFNEASASALNVLIQTRPFLPLVTAGIYEAASSNGSLNLNGKADESWTPLNKKTSSLLQTFKYRKIPVFILVAYDYKHLYKCYGYNFMHFT